MVAERPSLDAGDEPSARSGSLARCTLRRAGANASSLSNFVHWLAAARATLCHAFTLRHAGHRHDDDNAFSREPSLRMAPASPLDAIAFNQGKRGHIERASVCHRRDGGLPDDAGRLGQVRRWRQIDPIHAERVANLSAEITDAHSHASWPPTVGAPVA